MADECYSMVRGSALRVTSLLPCGSIPDPIPYGVAKCVSRVEINEVVEEGNSEVLRNDTAEMRLRISESAQTIRYLSDITFLRVDPGVLSIVAGVPLVYKPNGALLGFGEGPFGGGAFGEDVPADKVIGFDAVTRLPAKAFAMEVWSRLAAEPCSGQRRYGYTLFPFLKGGIIGGFAFTDGLMTFTLRGAKTRRNPKWGRGPFDLTGAWERMETPVSRNVHWRTFLTTAAPPEETNGVVEYRDILDGGTALTSPTPPVLVDGGTATADPTPPILIESGNAA